MVHTLMHVHCTVYGLIPMIKSIGYRDHEKCWSGPTLVLPDQLCQTELLSIKPVHTCATPVLTSQIGNIVQAEYFDKWRRSEGTQLKRLTSIWRVKVNLLVQVKGKRDALQGKQWSLFSCMENYSSKRWTEERWVGQAKIILAYTFCLLVAFWWHLHVFSRR